MMKKSETAIPVTLDTEIFAVREEYQFEGYCNLSYHRKRSNAEIFITDLIKERFQKHGEVFVKEEIILTGREGEVHTGQYHYTDGSSSIRVVPLTLKD